jgi:hypothetical protein
MQLTGSIEGVFDLLISNPTLNLYDTLKAGTVINYHSEYKINESIVDELNDKKIKVANGEREIYVKEPAGMPRIMLYLHDAATNHILMYMTGNGDVTVDWGDNSQLQTTPLSSTEPSSLYHVFDNDVDTRIIKIYGDFELKYFEFGNVEATIYFLNNVVVNRFSATSSDINLNFLALCQDTEWVNLTNSYITELTPLAQLTKTTSINLRGLQTTNAALNDMLAAFVDSLTDDRVACSVTLPYKPDDTGMELANTLKEHNWQILYLTNGSFTLDNI